MAADAAVFFGLWLQKPLRIAAANPSGPHLADALARFVELEKPGPVLELGAGTGSLTRGLVRAGCPRERIIAIEQEPSFAAVLRRDFPGTTVIEGNAARIGQYLAGHVERLSTVVSSLPIKWLARRLSEPSSSPVSSCWGRAAGFFKGPTHSRRRCRRTRWGSAAER